MASSKFLTPMHLSMIITRVYHGGSELDKVASLQTFS